MFNSNLNWAICHHTGQATAFRSFPELYVEFFVSSGQFIGPKDLPDLSVFGANVAKPASFRLNLDKSHEMKPDLQ